MEQIDLETPLPIHILTPKNSGLTVSIDTINNNIEKVYIAKIKGIIKGEQINMLKNGVIIDGRKTEKCHVKLKKADLKFFKPAFYIFMRLLLLP